MNYYAMPLLISDMAVGDSTSLLCDLILLFSSASLEGHENAQTGTCYHKMKVSLHSSGLD